MNLWGERPEEVSAQVENRYKVVVEFVVVADSAEDAELEVGEVIEEGMLSIMSQDDERETRIHSYDITDSDPAEVF